MKNISSFVVICFTLWGMAGCYAGSNSAEHAESTTSATSSTGEEHRHDMSAESARYVSKILTVKGDVLHPLVLTVDSLKKMNVVGLDSFNVVCQSGATTSRTAVSKGVLLKDILQKAAINQQNHKDRNFYIVAEAADGYKATFSWGEIFNNATGDNTYVTFEENGKPITGKGYMVLNCTNDKATGPRHVIWLNSIEVHRVK